MPHHTQYEHATSHNALLQVVRLCGGVTKLTNKLKQVIELYGGDEKEVTRSQVNNWVNRGDEIPYQYIVFIAFIANKSLKYLAPGNPANNIIKILDQKLPPLEVPIKNILLDNPRCLREVHAERPVVVDTHCVLITGLARFEAYKALGHKFIAAESVDIESLRLGERLPNSESRFLMSERGAIGLYLQHVVGSRQGQRNHLVKTRQKNNENPSSLRSELNEVGGRTDEEIGRLIGFNSIGTYHNIKQVCLHGTLELLYALDYKQLSISDAAKIAKLPKEHQLARIPKEMRRIYHDD